MNAKNLYKEDGSVLEDFWYCSRCGRWSVDKGISDRCCVCDECGYIGDLYPYSICEACRDKKAELRRQAKLAAAETITEDEAISRGLLFVYNDRPFETLDEAMEEAESILCDGDELPKYIYLGKRVQFRGPDIIDYIQEEADVFCEEGGEHLCALDELASYYAEWQKKQELYTFNDINVRVKVDAR